jgi:hypothetical protein
MARSGHLKMACLPDAAREDAVVDSSHPPPTSWEAPMPLIDIRLIGEVKSGDWAVGGQPVTTETVHALARGDVSLPV